MCLELYLVFLAKQTATEWRITIPSWNYWSCGLRAVIICVVHSQYYRVWTTGSVQMGQASTDRQPHLLSDAKSLHSETAALLSAWQCGSDWLYLMRSIPILIWNTGLRWGYGKGCHCSVIPINAWRITSSCGKIKWNETSSNTTRNHIFIILNLSLPNAVQLKEQPASNKLLALWMSQALKLYALGAAKYLWDVSQQNLIKLLYVNICITRDVVLKADQRQLILNF